MATGEAPTPNGLYDRSIVEERWNIGGKERSLDWVHGACDPVPVEKIRRHLVVFDGGVQDVDTPSHAHETWESEPEWIKRKVFGGRIGREQTRFGQKAECPNMGKDRQQLPE